MRRVRCSTTRPTPLKRVSFEEDERLKNDDKALIRYVQPRYINQVVKEFIELVRD